MTHIKTIYFYLHIYENIKYKINLLSNEWFKKIVLKHLYVSSNICIMHFSTLVIKNRVNNSQIQTKKGNNNFHSNNLLLNTLNLNYFTEIKHSWYEKNREFSEVRNFFERKKLTVYTKCKVLFIEISLWIDVHFFICYHYNI